MKLMKKIWRKIKLPLMFTVIYLLITAISFVLLLLVTKLITASGIVTERHIRGLPEKVFIIANLFSGAATAFVVGRIILTPVNKYLDAVDAVASGDYSVRVDMKGAKISRRLSEHFNNMARELGSVEMLSRDFINNFSHEFKTPIASIRGFANMLKRDDLTIDERNEYLDIIISESERLSELSSNVLTLSKVEQQAILTDVTRVNVSEQIRRAVSILDSALNEKNIEFSMTGDEIFIQGNENMLSQIWLNILGNAVKFSPGGGEVTVECRQSPDAAVITFTNECGEISEETLSHIFDKFYQGDASHTGKGNGLGLSIAKRIAELHRGNITASCADGKISFTVLLNQAQA